MAAFRAVAPFVGHLLLYIGLAFISLQTAYQETNTAAFWIPTGFSVGLILARGPRYWLVTAVGAFCVNCLVLPTHRAGLSLPMHAAMASLIALGNTVEAILGARLAQRFAGGGDFLGRPRAIVGFASTSVLIAPIPSALLGTAASALSGFVTLDRLPDMAATWYLADAVGLLIFTGPTLLCLAGKIGALRKMATPEGGALLIAIVFVGQSICGVYVFDGLASWPRTYMIVPVLLWASFRFGTAGASAAVVLLGIVVLLGTIRGFRAFPADTPTESLLVLQVFLALMAITALTISAALETIANLQRNLQSTVLSRSRDIEHLLRERELLTGLVAHDVKGPVLNSRNTLRALRRDLESGETDAHALETMRTIEATMGALVDRVNFSLSAEGVARHAPFEPNLRAQVHEILRARGCEPQWCREHVRTHGDFDLVPRRPHDVVFILDVLIDNALRYGRRDTQIDIFAFRHGGTLDITVENAGHGVPPDTATNLFKAPVATADERTGNGVGLYLASEQARSIGGRLTYRTQPAGHASFRVVLPL